MASKKENPLWGCLGLIILSAVGGLGFIAYIPLYYMLEFFKTIKFLKVRLSIKKELSDFWLTAEEQEEFYHAFTSLQIANKNKKEAIALGNAKNLSINADGSFSRKSKLGKKINQTIEQSDAVIRKYAHRYNYYENLPHNRWEEVIALYKRFSVSLFAVMAFFVGAYYYWDTSGYLDGSYKLFNLFLGLFIDMLLTPYIFLLDFFTEEPFVFFTPAVGISLFVLVVVGVRILYLKIRSPFSPEPPLVSKENYNWNKAFIPQEELEKLEVKEESENEEVIENNEELQKLIDSVDFEMQMFIHNYIEITAMDGELDDREYDILLTICEGLGISEEVLNILPPLEDGFQIPESKRARVIQIFNLILTSLLDKKMSPKEHKICNEFATIYGFGDTNIIDDFYEMALARSEKTKTEEEMFALFDKYVGTE